MARDVQALQESHRADRLYQGFGRSCHLVRYVFRWAFCYTIMPIRLFHESGLTFRHVHSIDGSLTLHELGTYRVVETLTKSAYLFSLYSNIEVQDGGVPQVITRLAVAVKRKVIVYTWQDGQGVNPKVTEA